ncbi:MAG: DUF4157 domain-containing protein, partial [Chloroflexi bacterium]|nr:DUF4157 domain-containing protein [Chloroflexota bacterium]
FAAHQYAPHSNTGRLLLAHELAHVVQQSAPQVIHRQADDEPRSDDQSQPSAASDVSTLNEDDVTPLTPESIEPMPTVGSADAAQAIVPVNDPSEYEAESVSRAVMQGVRLPLIRRASVALGRVQRQIYYEDRSALTWADFTGGPDASSPFDAVTWSGMEFPALQPEQKADSTGKKCTAGKKSTTEYSATVALNPAINVRALMKPDQSWVKEGKKVDKLLKHEQGHFDISNVLAEKTEAQLIAWANANKGSATKCGKTQALNEAIKQWNALDANTNLTAIKDKGGTLRRQAQQDYDDETKHSVDAAKQTAWEGEIAKNLPKYTF